MPVFLKRSALCMACTGPCLKGSYTVESRSAVCRDCVDALGVFKPSKWYVRRVLHADGGCLKLTQSLSVAGITRLVDRPDLRCYAQRKRGVAP